jgi:hypothetical protein
VLPQRGFGPADSVPPLKIEFVSHSSFVIDMGGVRLLADPWLAGTAFNEGWALLAPSAATGADLGSATHLWHSHEHPDHFSPPTLRSIPESARARIVALYQQTADRKVAGFCRGLGFREVVELAPGRWHALAPGVEVRCEPWTGGDSWLALRTPEATVVNLNDCAILDPAEVATIREKVGRVDLLATQFSISSWDGNPEDTERVRTGAEAMLRRMLVHVRALEPRWTLPFASFVWFCHEENAALNAFHNRVHRAVAELRAHTRTTPLVLFPGDAWELGAPHDPGPALARWEREYDSVATRPLVRAPSVPEPELTELSREWCTRVREGVDPLRLRVRLARQHARSLRAAASGGLPGALAAALALVTLGTPKAFVWVTDYEAAFCMSLAHGLRREGRPRERCDVELSSDSLRYAFRFLWGGETLQINARFRELRPESRRPFFQYLWLAAGRNRGETLGWRELFARLLRRAR